MAKAPNYSFPNLTPEQKASLGLIESLGIYELRGLARVFGDNSPTVLKRNDHIVSIMQKIITGEDLKPIPLRQGRPYKELSSIISILKELTQITGKDYTSTIKQQHLLMNLPVQKKITFKQYEDKIFRQKLYPIEARGILCERGEKDFYFINQDNGKLVLVNKSMDLRLKAYDYITGTACVMNAEKEYMLEDIKTINFQSFEKYQERINPYKQTLPTKSINFKNNKITLGARYCLDISKFIENAEDMQNLLKTLNENQIVTLAIIPNVMFEEIVPIKQLGFNNVVTLQYDDSPYLTFECLNNLIEHANRLQNEGINVALFVQDPITIANQIDFLFKDDSAKYIMNHSELAIDLIKRMVMLAKAGEGNKHTTLFITNDSSDLFDPMYVSSIYKVSNKINL